jgi:hypothetical protein
MNVRPHWRMRAQLIGLLTFPSPTINLRRRCRSSARIVCNAGSRGKSHRRRQAFRLLDVEGELLGRRGPPTTASSQAHARGARANNRNGVVLTTPGVVRWTGGHGLASLGSAPTIRQDKGASPRNRRTARAQGAARHRRFLRGFPR